MAAGGVRRPYIIPSAHWTPRSRQSAYRFKARVSLCVPRRVHIIHTHTRTHAHAHAYPADTNGRGANPASALTILENWFRPVSPVVRLAAPNQTSEIITKLSSLFIIHFFFCFVYLYPIKFLSGTSTNQIIKTVKRPYTSTSTNVYRRNGPALKCTKKKRKTREPTYFLHRGKDDRPPPPLLPYTMVKFFYLCYVPLIKHCARTGRNMRSGPNSILIDYLNSMNSEHYYNLIDQAIKPGLILMA